MGRMELLEQQVPGSFHAVLGDYRDETYLFGQYNQVSDLPEGAEIAIGVVQAPPVGREPDSSSVVYLLTCEELSDMDPGDSAETRWAMAQHIAHLLNTHGGPR